MKRGIIILFVCLGAYFNAYAQTYVEWVELSYEHLDRGDFEAAEAALKSAMQLEPGNPVNYALMSNLGTIQRSLGKLNDALQSYTVALTRHPTDPLILENRATLYTEIGEVDKAIVDYSMLLAEVPKYQDALYSRGILYLQKQDWLNAENDFEKLLDINQESFLGALGHAILEKMRGNYDESEQLYNFLIGRMPNEMLLYEGRADLYFLMGKNSRAINDINKVFFEGKPTAELYVLRGKIKLTQYEKAAAKKDFQTALEMGYDPTVIDELMKRAE